MALINFIWCYIILSQTHKVEEAIHKVRASHSLNDYEEVKVTSGKGIALLRMASNGIIVRKNINGFISLHWISSDNPPVLPFDYIAPFIFPLLSLLFGVFGIFLSTNPSKKKGSLGDLFFVISGLNTLSMLILILLP